MEPRRVAEILEAVARGALTPAEAAERLAVFPVAELGFASIDTHRTFRTGLPEAIFCLGKTPDQVRKIAERMLSLPGDDAVLATKGTAAHFEALRDLAPDARFDELSGIAVLRRATDPVEGTVTVVTAGTSDLAVAEEAAITAGALGARVERIVDVGVAGVHRALAATEQMRAADVLIVVAGMEGALPSLVAGLTRVPVIAVPTSVGYGASFGGLAALLAMLSSCAPGVAVVNIDNGFGAAALAARILRSRA